MKIFLSFLLLSQWYGNTFATNENRDDNERGKKGMLRDIDFDFIFYDIYSFIHTNDEVLMLRNNSNR